MKYAFYSDEKGGWLKVSIEEIRQLGILKDISEKSFVSNDRKYAFLEKDIDALLFINEALAADWYENFDAVRRCTDHYYSGPPSFIRNLQPFIGSQFIGKSSGERTNNVFHFLNQFIMFGKDFYPTPDNVIEVMMANTDVTNKVILEPSAGKGNIVDFLQRNNAKEVLACEINYDLQQIVASKCQVLEADFFQLKAEQISHINLVVMNPPFSADEKHILHAWEIAPGGCEIIALCNSETLNNQWNRNRAILRELIEANGSSESLYDCFTKAERETGVNVSLVRLYKPQTGEMEFDGYFDMQEEDERQENGIMTYNSIQEVVSRYVGAVKMFDDVINASNTINGLIAPISDGLGIHFGAYTGDHGNRYNVINRDVFKKALQKSAWRSVFGKFNMTNMLLRN
jgi:predicted RNA methylase